MVSLWPWKKDDSSPASFEKTLSALSAKIANTQANLDRQYSTSRRAKVLTTLYLSFAYLVYAIVALLVIGWRKMGAYEWTGMAGGPIVIYLVRTVCSAYFDLRIENLTARLKDQQGEREKTIQKLKDATKYDSTLELLQKYGGGEGRPKSKKKPETGEAGGNAALHGKEPRQNIATPNRTNLPPPPTANIQRSNSNILASYPASPLPLGAGPDNSPPPPFPSTPQGVDASSEFAPNAFDGARPPPPVVGGQYALGDVGVFESHWYDRIMDLLLGEDETAAKNRIVLICKTCRLVNGQAPPGTKTMAEIGMWKCMGCGAVNGEMDEGKRIVKEVLGNQEAHPSETSDEDVITSVTHDEDSSDLVEVENDGGLDGKDATPVKQEEETTTTKKRKGKYKGKN